MKINGRSRGFCCLLAAFVIGLAAPAWADDAKPASEGIEAGKKLLNEGDALADEGKPSEAVVKYKEAFEKLLPSLRHQPFRWEVNRDVTARDKLKDYILAEIDRDMTPGEFKANEASLKVFGLIPKDMNLKTTLGDLYAEEIAAFYDPRTDTMHLIDEKGGGRQPSFLERLMGRKGGFDKDENKTVIAHEMTHALADQHFDLKAMQDAINEDDDRSLALSALIEGEATLAMMGAQSRDWTGDQTTKLPAEELGAAMGLMGGLMPLFGGGQIQNAPAILRESMLFPYLRGMVFCASLANEKGWEGIDAAYRNPPLSTEQVLHPARYAKNPQPPLDFDFQNVKAPEGWTLLGKNVLGELQLSVLLKNQRGRDASNGWNGDRYAVFEGPEGRLGLVWRSSWDTENDAREFAASYARVQTSRLGDQAEKPAWEAMPDRLDREHDGACYVVARDGKDVVVVEGFPAEATKPLEAAAHDAAGCEKKPFAAPPLPERATPEPSKN